MSARSMAASSRQATNTVHWSPRSTSSSIRKAATSSAPRPTTRSCVRISALPKDPEQTALIAEYEKLAAPIANRRAGTVAETLSRVPNAAGESALGDVIADAQLAATRDEANGGAVIAFTNPGGIRTDIDKHDDGTVSYAEIFASQPFRNQLVTLTLTGAQIKAMLEQQWHDPTRPRVLPSSTGVAYNG